MTTFNRYAGIDQGTTSSRVLVLNENGDFEIAHVCDHKQITPNKGWVEHDPEELIANLVECIEKAGDIDAIGIDNQGETVVAWDSKTGKAVYNAIVWQDSRTQDTIEKLKAAGHEDYVKSTCGLPLDPYFSASKLSWIIQNVPEAQKLLDEGRLMLGTSDAFFLYRLCGVYATDYNTASRTSLLNLNTLTWDEKLCEIFNIPLEALPPIKDTVGIFGYYTSKKGNKIPVTASIVDQFAGLYGHGCRAPGDAKITFGTGAFLQSLTGYEPPACDDSGLLPMLAWKFPGQKPIFGLDGGVYNAASAINWVKKMGLFSDFKEISSYKDDHAFKKDVYFIPALSGLACPYWDRTAAALWAGMTLDTTRDDMIKACLEGVAFRANTVLQAMNKVSTQKFTLSVDGGMSVNPYFMQFLADLCQSDVSVPSCPELTALGSALLARAGLGVKGDITLGSDKTIYKHRTVEGLEEAKEHHAMLIKRAAGLVTTVEK